MNGIEYSQWYTTQTGSSQGIMALNLYTGQTLWVINTTYNLRCGMILNFPTIDQYGCVGPYIFAQSGGGFFASGPSTWYMYDGLTGQYLNLSRERSIIHLPHTRSKREHNRIRCSLQHHNKLLWTLPSTD